MRAEWGKGEKFQGKEEWEWHYLGFCTDALFPHYAATNWRHRPWDFTAKIRLYHLRYSQDASCRGNEFTHSLKNRKWKIGSVVNRWSSGIAGIRGHNEIITSKHCARGVTAVSRQSISVEHVRARERHWERKEAWLKEAHCLAEPLRLTGPPLLYQIPPVHSS